MEVARQSRDPDIFKLTTDCCDEIFEYLSLKDLHAFGQTCKTMQKVAGVYFKRNYSAAPKYSGNDGIYIAYSDDKGVINENIPTSGFNRYITYISHYYEKLRPLHYIQSHSDEFESINHIYLVCLIINEARVNCLMNLLPKIETLQIRNSSVEGHLNDMLLKHCANIRRLFVQDSDLGIFRLLDGGWAARIENHWLRQEYPKLEYLELIPKYTNKIDELNEFFERNPTVQAFSTSTLCLWKNRKELLKSTATLEMLEVKEASEMDMIDDDDDEEFTLIEFCNLLKQLHRRRFFKRLNFYTQSCNEETSTHLTSLGHCLEKLCIKNFTRSYSLPLLTNLKELAIQDGANSTDMDILANSLPNLQRLHINKASVDDIQPFIRQSPKLRQIKVLSKDEAHFNRGILKLLTLNQDREKLAQARKVSIYVPDNIFLRTKWSVNYGDTNLSLIEMKRCDSIEWNDHY
ncbi:uncharacterized protein LOC129570790 [Sitodiplosis mosellana]|uniref:uncharacterized protein LOC129570790 n=1 Tax=Sitodiplosis mosellana TaxID=263140 RepID=UPI0024452230|nr:uncharacterized protein LOC129570790 [Sitodiplosis mosellana]XP_055306489.1 uncharacterized protein LOC129570790 [Sitodiplosis mosellana]